jgi:hypothetical protein
MTEIPKLQLKESEDRFDDRPAKIVNYELIDNGRVIGNASLAFDRAQKSVSVDWVYINEGEWGKRFGSSAMRELFRKAESNEWVQTIEFITEDVAAIRAVLGISPEGGWRRSFAMSTRIDDEKVGDELFSPAGTTEDPDEALTCVEMRGSVNTTFERVQDS